MIEIQHEGYRPTLWERVAAAPHPSRSFQASLWHATAPPPPASAPLTGAASTDVAIVGGGYLGLSTALHLAEAGVAVTVLEADEPGFGASGRNTGFVVPNLLTGLDPAGMRAALGAEHGDLLCRMVGGGADLVFDLIRRHGMDAQARQTGWLQPIHTPEKRAWLDDRVAQWRGLGQEVRLLDRDEAVYETGSPSYHGAFFDPSGGHLNPLAYCRGLAAAAIAAGAALHTTSRVRHVARGAGGWRVTTDGGELTAKRLLLTINVTGGGVAPAAENTQIPITLFQVATQPLDPALRETVLPHDRCSADTRKDLIAYRWSSDNRLVTGGLLANPFGSVARGRHHHLDRLRALLPQLPELTADYAWQGRLGAAKDFLPRLMTLGPNGWSANACNGRGMAMTTAFGRALARWLAGGANDRLPVPVTKPDPVPTPALSSLAISAWLPFNRWADRRALARARRAGQ